MFIEEFSFGNFKSFKDIQTLRMSAAKIKSKNKTLDTQNVLTANDTQFLKSKVIYGANASGKSNTVKALVHFISIIGTCLKKENALEYFISPFMYSTEAEKEPSYFQLIFHIENKKYRYGFEASQKKIHSEWLYITHNIREVPVFLRENQNIIEISKTHLPKGYEISKLRTKLLTEKVLFLSLIKSFEEKLAETILKNIFSISVCGNQYMDILFEDYIKNKNDISKIADFIKLMDTGINNIILAKTKSEKPDKEENVLISSHKKYNELMEEVAPVFTVFNAVESDGTRQMLFLSPVILKALKTGSPVIIDEFGSQLHSLLAKEIISLFNSPKNNKSQIIVATHTTELMSSDLLRKDQIDFVEKDVYGRSYLYTLVEINGIRNTASFENDYLKGKYGAIPFLGNHDEFEKICNET